MTPIPFDVTAALTSRLDAKPIHLWDAWLFAEAEASLALATWTRAPTSDKARTFATYTAALDREEQAGRALALRFRAHPRRAADSS